MSMNDSQRSFPQRQMMSPQSRQMPPPPFSPPPFMPQQQMPPPPPPQSQLPFGQFPSQQLPPPPLSQQMPLPSAHMAPTEQTELQKLQAELDRVIRSYTQEQIRLYFFPFPERQYKELWKRLMRWFMYLGGLLLLLIVIYVTLVASQQGLTTTGVFGDLLSVIVIVLIFWLAFKYVVPLWRQYRFEYNEHMKEQQHLAQHRPPTDQEYNGWITYMGRVIYEMAEEKLHLPESKEHKDWRERKEKTGEEFGPRPEKRREYDADLRIKGVEYPSGDRNYLLRLTKQDKQNVVLVTSKEELDHSHPLRRGGNFSINTFTRLFVTKDFITIYSNTINVRQPERVQEKAEHFYHQHLTYVSMKVDGSKIGDDMLMIQELTLMLDSGHTIPLNVASATFSYKNKKNGERNEVAGVDSVHGGLIRALQEHKISVLESNIEADKAKEAFPGNEFGMDMQF